VFRLCAIPIAFLF